MPCTLESSPSRLTINSVDFLLFARPFRVYFVRSSRICFGFLFLFLWCTESNFTDSPCLSLVVRFHMTEMLSRRNSKHPFREVIGHFPRHSSHFVSVQWQSEAYFSSHVFDKPGVIELHNVGQMRLNNLRWISSPKSAVRLICFVQSKCLSVSMSPLRMCKHAHNMYGL